MTHAELRSLLAYDEWANARWMGLLAGLPEELLEMPTGGSFPSLRALAAHIVAVEWVWLRRWTGASPAAPPDWMGSAGPLELHARLAEVESERQAWLAGVDDVERVVSYTLMDGSRGERRLADLVLHVVNHSTYHRGQLAENLRRLGVSPAGTDLLEFTGSSL